MEDEPPDRAPVRIPDPVTVKDLATALARRPFQIVADLLTLGQFTTNVEALVHFETAAKIVRHYGYEAQKIG